MMWAKVAAGVGFIAILYAVYWGIDDNGYERGRLEVQSKWDVERIQLAKEAREAAEKNQRRISELEMVKNENIKTIDDLRGNIADLRVRVPKTPCPRPVTPDGGIDPPAAGGEPADTTQEAFDEFRRGLESDAAGADKVIEDCRVVIEWAKGLVKK